MAERLKAPAWKASIRLNVSRVRIPLSPPWCKTGGQRFLVICNPLQQSLTFLRAFCGRMLLWHLGVDTLDLYATISAPNLVRSGTKQRYAFLSCDIQPSVRSQVPWWARLQMFDFKSAPYILKSESSFFIGIFYIEFSILI